jgi:hypothetical protein
VRVRRIDYSRTISGDLRYGPVAPAGDKAGSDVAQTPRLGVGGLSRRPHLGGVAKGVGGIVETAGGRALTPARGTLLRVRRSSKFASFAVAATTASFVALALGLTGHPAPIALTRALAIASAPLAAALAVRNAAAYWRGPALLHFPVEYAVLCYGQVAEAVRAAAHLRGALGGAGHLHKTRLLFPVVAWLAAAAALGYVALGATGMPGYRRALGVLALTLAARIILPPRAFWYRERRDGSLVVYPASIRARVSERTADVDSRSVKRKVAGE